MMIFWILYFLLSFTISILLSFLVEKRLFKILIFSTIFSIFSTIWFKNPGISSLAPIFTIFLLESTIVENNGLTRLFRPMIFIFILIFLASTALWKKDTKS